jgi:hypothetical protein
MNTKRSTHILSDTTIPELDSHQQMREGSSQKWSPLWSARELPISVVPVAELHARRTGEAPSVIGFGDRDV